MNVELPEPVRAFDDAQRRALVLLSDVVCRLEAGMSERDIFELAETRLGANGFDRWYHPPEVRIRRAQTPLWPFPSASRKLAPGDLVTLDVGPGTEAVYGDAGYTLKFGGEGDEPDVVRVARECLRACCGYASRWKTVGEIFVFAKSWAINHRMDLGNRRSLGHRILPREGVVATGFPRSAHFATVLGRNRIHRLNPVRMDGMFAVRPEIVQDGHAASFEEILYVHENVRVVLGRGGLDEVGTLAG